MKYLIASQLKQIFESKADRLNAAKQRAYLKGNGEFYGLKKPEVTDCLKKTYKDYPIHSQEELVDIINDCWNQKEREFHYAAIFFATKYKKLWSPQILTIFESMIRTQPWWDTVDTIASRLVGPLIEKYPLLIDKMDIWIVDDFLWIRRSALLAQLFFKEKTDQNRLFNYCTSTAHDKDFFMRKAIGWALRQYSKTNPQAVKAYILASRDHLSNLSIKEGSKYI